MNLIYPMEQTNPTVVVKQTEQTKTEPAETQKDWLQIYEANFIAAQLDTLHGFELNQIWQLLEFYHLCPSVHSITRPTTRPTFFQVDVCQTKVNMVLDNSTWSIVLDDCDRVIFKCSHREAISIPWPKQLDTSFIRKCQLDQMREKLRDDKFVFEEKRHCEEGEPYFSILHHGQNIVWALDNNKWYLTPEGKHHLFICTHGVALNTYWKAQLDNIGTAHVEN